MSVSDIVTNGSLPDAVIENPDAWSCCVAGALDVSDYIAAIEDAGFVEVELAPVVLDEAVLQDVIGAGEIKEGRQAVAANLESGTAPMIDLGEPVVALNQPPIFSAKVTARKPDRAS